jgi:hypothetical protein
MADTQVFLVATALMRVLEQVSLAVISTDPVTMLRLALFASECRFEVLR